MNPRPKKEPDPKEEPLPADSPAANPPTGPPSTQPSRPKPRPPTARPTRGGSNATPRGGNTTARGRGGPSTRGGSTRGASRSRGRGRVIVPRQVPRRKLSAKKLKEHQEAPRESPAVRGGRGRGRGRGRGGRGGRVAPTYAPNVVGLGQIAPPRPSKALSSGGSAASRRSSVVSSLSVGGVSSTGGVSSSSVGAELMEGVAGLGVIDGRGEGRGGGGGGGGSKVDQKLVTFMEHCQVGEDSDDDMPEAEFDYRNRDIAPYAGKLTENGLLLPVSLPGLRDMPPEYKRFEGKMRKENVLDGEGKTGDPKPEPVLRKEEPLEIGKGPVPKSGAGGMRPDMFEKGTVAHHILSSESALMFMQLPGLLALSENEEIRKQKGLRSNADMTAQSSVTAALAAAERIRGLGTDLRCVGETGSVLVMGKLRFYQSGRVQIVMEPGGAMDVIFGVQPKVCHQAVLVDTEKKTCEELESTVQTRLIAVPDMSPP